MTEEDERRLTELALTMRAPHLNALLQVRRHNDMTDERWAIYAIEVLAHALEQMTRTAIEFATKLPPSARIIIETGAHSDDETPHST